MLFPLTAKGLVVTVRTEPAEDFPMAPPNFENRTLFQGDNLPVLRAMNSDSVDLIATDPPFNKGRDFHATPDSLASGAKFQDRWSWERDVHEDWTDRIKDDYPHLMEAIESARYAHSDGMGAFMCFMAVRLMEMRRVLKPTGAIYLHFDSTAVHYLKAIMDSIFGWQGFVNEIIWQKIRSSKAQRVGFGEVHDVILLYQKTRTATFNKLYVSLSPERIARHYGKTEPDTGRRYGLDNFTQAGPGKPKRFGKRIIPPPSGKHWIWDQDRIDQAMQEGRLVFTSENMVRVKRYLDESRGNPMEDIWIDIPPINAMSKNRTGYPTQKPLALYERIIKASSNPGDIVLDPFAGCATTLIAAERLGRQWIGIDIWDKACDLVQDRLSRELLDVDKGISGEQKSIGYGGQVSLKHVPPIRTDKGEVTSPYLRVKVRVKEPDSPGWTRAQMYEYLLEQYGPKCQGCDRAFDDSRYLELDHNTPRSDGGSNQIHNRVLLCSPCNRAKSNIYTLSGLRKLNRKNEWMVKP